MNLNKKLLAILTTIAIISTLTACDIDNKKEYNEKEYNNPDTTYTVPTSTETEITTTTIISEEEITENSELDQTEYIEEDLIPEEVAQEEKVEEEAEMAEEAEEEKEAEIIPVDHNRDYLVYLLRENMIKKLNEGINENTLDNDRLEEIFNEYEINDIDNPELFDIVSAITKKRVSENLKINDYDYILINNKYNFGIFSFEKDNIDFMYAYAGKPEDNDHIGDRYRIRIYEYPEYTFITYYPHQGLIDFDHPNQNFMERIFIPEGKDEKVIEILSTINSNSTIDNFYEIYNECLNLNNTLKR